MNDVAAMMTTEHNPTAVVVKSLWILALSCLVLLGSAGAPRAQVGVTIGGGALAWPGTGAYPYPPYGAYAPWIICGPGYCVDDFELRRALRREMRLYELRRELDLRASGESPGGLGHRPEIHASPAPPTPESHLQPGYRGTGDVRPEYRDAGKPR